MTLTNKIMRCGWTAALASALLLAGCVSDQDRQRLQDGYAAYNAKQYAKASNIADNYIQSFPQDPHVDEAYYLRALTRLAAGDKAAAQDDLQQAYATASRPDLRAKSARALGDLAYDRAAYAEAIKHYQQALAANPQSPEAQTYYRLGAALQAIGRWDEARGPLNKVLILSDSGGWDDYARRRLGVHSYSLQFGAFRDLEGARRMARGLQQQKIAAEVFKEQRGTSPLYTVRAGSYETLALANAAKERLRASHIDGVVYP